MDKFYQEAGTLKNIYIGDQFIMGSTEEYKNKETFLSKLNAEDALTLDKHMKFEYNQITKIHLLDEPNTVQVYFVKQQGGDEYHVDLHFYNRENFDEVSKFILAQCSHGTPSEKVSGSMKTTFKPAMYTLVALMFSAAVVLAAIDIESGKTLHISGSKKGAKQLLATIAETLGMWGSIAVGTLVVAGFVVYTYKTYKGSKVNTKMYTIQK